MTDLGSVANLESYKELIDKFKKLDIATKELTLFDVGTRGHFENPTTELLSFFIDDGREHGLKNCFVKDLQDVLMNRKVSTELGNLLSVETEVSTDKGNRIDLLLETDEVLIIVECKIYHQKNNPFDNYTSYGMQRTESGKKDNEKNKNLIQLVLCLDGRIEPSLINKGWHGISYKELVVEIEPHLSEALLANPYNKWGLFAREFLLHLRKLDNMGEISKDEIEFLTENINGYFKLSEYFYKNLMPRIAKKVKIDLDSSLSDFLCQTKIDKWNYYEPHIRFYNEKWNNSSSGIVLCIRNNESSNEMSFTIHIEFYNKVAVTADKLKKLIKNYEANSEVYRENLNGNNIWFMWRYNDFNIEEVSERIIKLMNILNDFELNHRPLTLE